MQRFRFQFRLVSATVLSCAVTMLCCALPTCAQETSPTPQMSDDVQNSTGSERRPGSTDTGVRPKQLILRGKELEAYLKSLPGLDQFEITSLELDGIVQASRTKATRTTESNRTNEVARINATLKIRILDDNQWVRVPVEMSEAVLTAEETYTGEGQHRFDTKLAATSGRQAWFIRGAGQHTLKLPLIVPLSNRVHTRHRLRLTLPVTATSHLKIQLPNDNVKVETSARTGAFPKTSKGKTVVDVYGLGTDFDLTWEQLPKVQNTGSRLRLDANRIVADLSKSPVEFRAEQTVTAAQGNFKGLTVTVPKGLRVRDVTERREVGTEQYFRDYRIDDTGDRTKVTVSLSRPCSDSLRLIWDLEPIDQAMPGKFAFESFRIAGVNVNKGVVEVIVPIGFEIERLDGRDASRRQVTSAFTAQSQIATAYDMTSDQSRLLLDIREIEPQFSIIPALRLNAADGSLNLRAVFTCPVRRGALKEIALTWPGYLAEEWDGLDVDLDGELLKDWQYDISDDGRLTIQFESRQSGEFQFAFRTSRKLTRVVGEDSEITTMISLPEVAVDGSRQRQTEASLLLSEAEDLSIKLTPATESTSLTLEPLRTTDLELPETQDARLKRYRLGSANHRFAATIKEQQRELTAKNSVQVSIADNRADVEQRMMFNIGFRRLNDFQLVIPEAIGENVELFNRDVRLEKPRLTAFAQTVVLPEDVLGETEIVARYSIDLTRTDSLRIPLLKSSDVAFSSTRLEINSDVLKSAPADMKLWTRKSYSDSGNLAWESIQPIDDVEVTLTEDSTRPEHRYSVKRAFAQTVIDGSFKSQIQFEIEGNPDELKLTVPADCRYDKILWNNQAIEPTETETTETGLLLTIRVPEVTEQTSTLRISYHSTVYAQASWFNDFTLSSPGFPDGVWVDETSWQISTGGQQLLFDFNGDYSSRYRWKRNGFVWHRQSNSQTGIHFFNMNVTGPANTYLVARLGKNVPLRILTLHRTVLFLSATAVALVFGFVMFRLTRPRAFALIGVTSVLVAIASMVRPIPIELFIQPAVCGLALACIAAAFEWMSQRRPESALKRRRMTPAIDDVTVPPSAGLSTGSITATSEDRTVVRTGPIISAQPGKASESTQGSASEAVGL